MMFAPVHTAVHSCASRRCPRSCRYVPRSCRCCLCRCRGSPQGPRPATMQRKQQQQQQWISAEKMIRRCLKILASARAMEETVTCQVKARHLPPLNSACPKLECQRPQNLHIIFTTNLDSASCLSGIHCLDVLLLLSLLPPALRLTALLLVFRKAWPREHSVKYPCIVLLNETLDSKNTRATSCKGKAQGRQVIRTGTAYTKELAICS